MEVTSLKINKSEIAREFEVDRRIVSKYVEGFKKSKTRKRLNALSPYLDIIHKLISPDCPQVFYYKRVLFQYLKDNCGYYGSYKNFCEFISELKN